MLLDRCISLVHFCIFTYNIFLHFRIFHKHKRTANIRRLERALQIHSPMLKHEKLYHVMRSAAHEKRPYTIYGQRKSRSASVQFNLSILCSSKYTTVFCKRTMKALISLRRLIWAFDVHKIKRRLIWAFVVRKLHKNPFLCVYTHHIANSKTSDLETINIACGTDLSCMRIAR